MFTVDESFYNFGDPNIEELYGQSNHYFQFALFVLE